MKGGQSWALAFLWKTGFNKKKTTFKTKKTASRPASQVARVALDLDLCALCIAGPGEEQRPDGPVSQRRRRRRRRAQQAPVCPHVRQAAIHGVPAGVPAEVQVRRGILPAQVPTIRYRPGLLLTHCFLTAKQLIPGFVTFLQTCRLRYFYAL